jgi:hypothetical protein
MSWEVALSAEGKLEGAILSDVLFCFFLIRWVGLEEKKRSV